MTLKINQFQIINQFCYHTPKRKTLLKKVIYFDYNLLTAAINIHVGTFTGMTNLHAKRERIV